MDDVLPFEATKKASYVEIELSHTAAIAYVQRKLLPFFRRGRARVKGSEGGHSKIC